MRRTLRNSFVWILGTVSLLLVLLLGLHVLGLMPGLARLYEASRYRDFHLAGQVVDQAEQPINGVFVRVTTSRRIKMGTDSHTETKHTKINGHFDLTLKDYSSVELAFICEGYEMETRMFTDGGSHRNLQIVLAKKGSATKPA